MNFSLGKVAKNPADLNQKDNFHVQLCHAKNLTYPLGSRLMHNNPWLDSSVGRAED